MGRKQESIDAGVQPTALWKASRPTKAMRNVETVLRAMAGGRERCMYCSDSRGTDIEHFWPRETFPERTFLWENLLWSCTGCNRIKGTRFPRAEDGAPLLIDPTTTDPWDHLFYEAATDQVVPRFDPAMNASDVKGRMTLEVIRPLSFEAVQNGRGKVRRSLVRAVRAFLANHAAEPEQVEEHEETLKRTLFDHDEYGLVEWFFCREGASSSPFRELRESHPDTWARILVERAG